MKSEKLIRAIIESIDNGNNPLGLRHQDDYETEGALEALRWVLGE